MTRPRIALITNHGYAGVEIPVGGAPDTGGQNFYVNSLAQTLCHLGMEVTIFARGGFPFFKSEKIRQGTEQLTEHARYVYIPGGGDEFLRKEDIAVALDEETNWLARFICDEAKAAGVEPWEYYECVNTHYWDAAVIGYKLVERWQDQATHDFISKAAGGALADHLDEFEGDERHRLSLSREAPFHLSAIAKKAFKGKDVPFIIKALTGHDVDDDILDPESSTAQSYRDMEKDLNLGLFLAGEMLVEERNLEEVLSQMDTHVWTPHSIGIIKERNFWDKDLEEVRKLKFRERNAHEESVCENTPLFCSTSPEIWRSLVSYHGVSPERIFDFPPCIDKQVFRPRKDEELDDAYAYLAKESGIDEAKLRGAKIIFETSRMDRTKRKDLLLSSFAKVTGKIDDVYLFIGGGPKSSPVFKELEEHHGSLPQLKGRAFLLGFIPDEVLEPLFSVPDLFVSASEMEGFGMSVSQAAAAQVAVISSDLIPFATQYAKDAAVIVEAGDIDAFADAMEKILTDDEDRAKRAAALKEIADQLDWNATTSRFLKWFKENR